MGEEELEAATRSLLFAANQRSRSPALIPCDKGPPATRYRRGGASSPSSSSSVPSEDAGEVEAEAPRPLPPPVLQLPVLLGTAYQRDEATQTSKQDVVAEIVQEQPAAPVVRQKGCGCVMK